MDSSKLKEFPDNSIKFYENGRKFSKMVENAVGKGEIARYEQFLLFPQCFQKTFTADMQKTELVWERVKLIIFVFQKLEKIVKKGENAGYQIFPFFFHNLFKKSLF